MPGPSRLGLQSPFMCAMSFTPIPFVGSHGARPGLNISRDAVALLLSAALAACSVGPSYKRPDVPLPSTWQADSESPAWPSATWWQEFNSPKLDDLMSRAQRANDDLAAAVARVKEADAQAQIAGAALLPAVGGNAQATRERTQTSVGPVTSNLYVAQLSASYELDFWGKNRALRRAAVETAQASHFDRETVELTVMAGVASTYFQVLELRDRLAVTRDNLAAQETTLKGLKLEQSVGTATALDVAQQETTVATLNATIPSLEQQIQQTGNTLAILIGEPTAGPQIAEGTLADLALPAVDSGLPSELLTRRPDVAEAEAQLKAANANITVARAAFFPSISLTASGGFESNALSTLFDPASKIFALSAGLAQPIFEGGALSGQLAYSKARYAELLADYHKAVISAFANTEDALVAVQRITDQERLQQDAVAKARRAYDISQAQFHAGTINILTVINTENALFTAEDTFIQVKFLHLQALVNFFNALGGGWQQTKGA